MSTAVVYDNYVSVWRLIDDGRLDALLGSEDLPVVINEKQKGVTPLFLVRSHCILQKYGILAFLRLVGQEGLEFLIQKYAVDDRQLKKRKFK